LLWPDEGGPYLIKVKADHINNSSDDDEFASSYIWVNGEPFTYINVEWVTYSTGEKNLFTI
jgi:hypothetical protein